MKRRWTESKVPSSNVGKGIYMIIEGERRKEVT